MRFFLLLFLALQVANAQELSYSGRLVNSNGSPVTGIVDLQFDIAYSGNPSVILCSKTLTGVGLTNGLFHVNIDLTSSDCASSKEFVDIVSETPANESVVLQLTDLTNAKVYPHHAFKSVPLSIQANIARTLHSMGATTGQVLRWDGNKWSPQTFGGGVGSVTEIQTGSGLSGGPITSSGTIIIATGGVTSSHIADNTITNADINTSAGIARSKLATGAANQVVINDGAGALSSVAQLPLNLGGTGATTAAAARANLELGNVATRDVGLNTGNVLIADEVPSCLPHQKIQKSALAPYIFSCAADNDSEDVTKLPLAGGTMTGPIVLDADPTLNLHAATKQYVDARSSQWITSGSNIFYSTGNVGIGMNNPSARLDIDGQIRISGGNPGVGKVLTSSVDGLATWETPTSDADNLGNHIATQNIRLGSHWLSGDGGNEGIRIDSTGNVGVGTATPSSELHVRGSSNPSITISDTEVGESSEAGLFLETDGASGGLSVLSANFSNPITWADSLLLYSDNINSGGLRLHANSGNITLSNGWSPRVDRLIINPAGNVEVNGQVKINGGSPGAGKVLTSDASGLASWQTPAAGGMTALTGDVTASGSGSVTATIANDAVTTAKILDGTILDADIANSTITYSKLNLADGSIPMAKLIRMTCLAGEVITSDASQGFRCVPDNATDVTKLPLAGGVMTGNITLVGDPTANLHATTKQYVDNAVSANSSKWMASGADIYRLSKVGIGTNSPVNNLSVFAPYSSASASGSSQNGGFRLMNTTDAVVLDMGIGINTTAWMQARDPSNYATKRNLLLNPVGGHVTIGSSNMGVGISTNNFTSANGLLGVIGNDATSADSFGILVLSSNRTTHASGDTAGELRFTMTNNNRRDLALISSKAEGVGGANGFGGNLLFSVKQDNVNSSPVEVMRISNLGNVGIGTIAPDTKLHVAGQVKITGGSPGAGKVLTSDASGLATWETPGAGVITALTGDVTASGSGSVAATIANNAITSAKILDGTIGNADIANASITYSKLNIADGSIPIAKLIRMTCLPGEVITSDVTLGFRCIADNSTDTTKLPLAGGTMTGAITLAGDPTANLHAATKQYVDARASQWITSGNNIYSSNLGNVGIGTTTPSSKLEVAGGLRVANGSVAAPSISFTNKSDTGLYLGSGEQVGVVAGGNLAASFTPLDTYFYSPVYLANGTASEYAIGSTSSAGLFFPNVGSLAVSTSGQERLRVDSTGNVGIGLTNPGAKLEVAGQVKITGGAPGAGKVLTSNAAGLATWETPGSGGMTALTGDVTASGSGSVAATIADNAITSAKILDGTIGNADIANGSISFLKLNLPNGIIPISKLELLNCPAGEVITSNSPLGYRCVPDNTTDTTKLPLAGGTMTGPLILSGNPAINLAAATKQYVDSAVSAAGSKWIESVGNIFRPSGKVGIGMATTPAAILHVDAGSLPTGFDGGDIVLKTGWDGTSANRGKVSLGPSAGHSAPYDLTLTTSGNSYNYQVGVPNSPGAGVSLEILASGAGSNSSHWKGGDVIISGGQTYGGSALSNIFFKTAGGGTLGTPVAPSTKMMISGTGNVGIGTTSPSAKLHVEGEVKFGNTSSTCNSANEGQQRYNSTLKVMEYCNGTRWQGYSTGISSCPSGWVMIGDAGKAATYCIQEDESTAANFWNAMSTCDAINDATLGRAHLCTLYEWYTACTRGTGLLNMKNNTEMVAQTVGSTSYLTIGGPSCETTQSDSFNGTWWYRCCIK